jgi:hypothetical protein
LKLYPCSVDGQGNLLNYENKVNELILSVYDSQEAMGYSLRDKDDKPVENIDTPVTLPKMKRFMLSCRCSENLFLSDDVLQYVNTTWDETKSELHKWIENNSSHKKYIVEAIKLLNLNLFNTKVDLLLFSGLKRL